MALSDFFTKKYAQDISNVNLAFSRVLFSLPVLWTFLLLDGIPVINSKIIWIYAVGLPLELTATILYIKAIRLSPLSVTVPFLAFTPAFLLITSPLMLGEYPSYTGIIGVLVIVTGAYMLNLGSVKHGLLHPFRMIVKEKGSLIMLLVAFIFSINSNLGKMGVLYSSPAFVGATFFTLMTLVFFVYVCVKKELASIFKKELAIIGVLSALMIASHLMAMKLIYVSYMISIKRSSLLISILLGYFFLQEKGLKERLVGGILMLAGILIITFFG